MHVSVQLPETVCLCSNKRAGWSFSFPQEHCQYVSFSAGLASKGDNQPSCLNQGRFQKRESPSRDHTSVTSHWDREIGPSGWKRRGFHKVILHLTVILVDKISRNVEDSFPLHPCCNLIDREAEASPKASD